jgi:hypothetical protein
MGERVTYSLTWTHPEQWRLLQTIDLRISDEQGTILQVHWDQPANTFTLVDPDRGEFGSAAVPGEPGRLETSAAALSLAQSSIIGSGPTGPSVTLNFAVSFKPQAAGRTFNVEAFATDDFGHEQGWERVGILTVLEK